MKTSERDKNKVRAHKDNIQEGLKVLKQTHLALITVSTVLFIFTLGNDKPYELALKELQKIEDLSERPQLYLADYIRSYKKILKEVVSQDDYDAFIMPKDIKISGHVNYYIELNQHLNFIQNSILTEMLGTDSFEIRDIEKFILRDSNEAATHLNSIYFFKKGEEVKFKLYVKDSVVIIKNDDIEKAVNTDQTNFFMSGIVHDYFTESHGYFMDTINKHSLAQKKINRENVLKNYAENPLLYRRFLFPGIEHYWYIIKDMTFKDAYHYLNEEKNKNISKVNLIGISLGQNTLIIGGPLIIIGILIYLSLHLNNLHCQIKDVNGFESIKSFPWSPFFDNIWAKFVVFFTIAILPVISIISISYLSPDRSSYTFFLLISLVVIYKSMYNIYLINREIYGEPFIIRFLKS